MAEGMLSYKVTVPPHIRAADSLIKRSRGQLLALAPVFVTACLTGHAKILRVLLICLVSALAFEFLAAKFFRKKESLQGGEVLLSAALFSLLMPVKCSSEVVILGVFMTVFVARELFGGTGSYLLQPLLLARVFLQICFPAVMTEPMLFSGQGDPWVLMSIILGGAVLFKQKQGYWESPVLFAAVCLALGFLPGGTGMSPAFFSGILFTAFFLLADPVTLPLTRRGTTFFILGAALLSSALDPKGFSIRSASYAILGMNLLTPWLDVWLKPVPYKAKQHLKATYPV